MKTYGRREKSKTHDISWMCRLCLSQIVDHIEIFVVDPEPLTNVSIIQFCTGIECDEKDGLPSRMCTECYRNLIDFFAFKRMCLASESHLKHSRDVASKVAENQTHIASPLITEEPEDELSLAKNNDLVLLEKDSVLPGTPYEVFSQMKSESNDEVYCPPVVAPQKPVSCSEEIELVQAEEVQENPDLEEIPIVLNVEPVQVEKPDTVTTTCSTKPTNVEEHDKNMSVCRYCYKEFRNSCSLRRHIRTHEETPFKCPECGKQFAQKDSMKRHSILHTDRRFICSLCSKILLSREGLKCHIRTHHSERNGDSYFKYKCKACEKRFAHSSGLSRHMAIHRGIQYPCDLCPRKFNDSSQVKRHKMQHKKDEFVNVDLMSKPAENRNEPVLNGNSSLL